MVKTLKKRNGIYYARLRLNPKDSITERTLKTRDKEVAQKRLNELARQMEREAEGLATPTKMKEAAHVSLERHISRYMTAREAEWTSEKHAQASRDRLKKLIRECGWKQLKDIDALSFMEWRSQQQKLSPKTLNEYLSVLNQFLTWLSENGMIEENPVSKVRRIKVRGRNTFQRRAFTMKEIGKLMETPAESLPERMRKRVESRQLTYLGAIYTGLRRTELASLEWGDVFLDSETPHLAVRASTTKNGKDASIPLHPVLAESLRKHKPANGKATEKVFSVPKIDTFREDLKRAEIEYEDERGHRADFHALRKTFGTLMQLSGVNPRTAQELMRHSDIKLTTQIYTDANLLPKVASIQSLPDVLHAPHTDPKNGAKWDKTSPVASQTKEGDNPRNPWNLNVLDLLSPSVSQDGNGAPIGTTLRTDFM